MNEWVGKTLGKVRIESRLARGGMAEVYLGTHTTLERQVAVKILRNQYEDDPDLLERFQREARVVAKLRHQNIVQVYDFDSVDERPYIVMEYVSGPSLSAFLTALHKNKQRLELSEINRILLGVANALQYAHQSGVIHRDIKPGNILLTSRSSEIVPGEPLPWDFEPVLTDFGLVRFLNSARQTSAGQTAGTPAYMSPEQARGETTDGRTDIYSLGVVVYEMLSGKVPFDGESTIGILMKHITEPPPQISGLSPTLQNILNQALAKDSTERFQSPAAFANAFNAVVTDATPDEKSTFMGIVPVSEAETSVQVEDPDPSVIVIKAPQKGLRQRLTPISIGVVTLSLIGVMFMRSGLISASTVGTPTAQVQVQSTPSITEAPQIPVSGSGLGDPIAVLHFQDGNAILDQAYLEALAMPAPPPGSEYEAWLVGPEGRISLGILQVDAFGKGTLTFDAGKKEDLFAAYNQIEITIKPIDANTNETEHLAYSYTMPNDVLGSLQQLLVSSPNIPDQASLIQGLANDTELLVQNSNDMLQAYNNNDQTGVTKLATNIWNILVGAQSPTYKELTSNSDTPGSGSGYGFLLNGTSPGYIRDIFQHADFIVRSSDANEETAQHGNEVKVCADNLTTWISDLKDQTQTILGAASLSDMEVSVKTAVDIAKKIEFGSDVSGNLKSEAILGECGVLTTQMSAYEMADLPIFPAFIAEGGTTATPSPTGTFTVISASPTKGSGSGNNTTTTTNSGGNGNNGSNGNHGTGNNGNGGGNGGGNGNNGKGPTSKP